MRYLFLNFTVQILEIKLVDQKQHCPNIWLNKKENEKYFLLNSKKANQLQRSYKKGGCRLHIFVLDFNQVQIFML